MLAIVLIVLAKLSPLLAVMVLLLAGTSLFLSRKVKRLDREAHHDPLTGLLNRRGLARAWEADTDNRALLFIDLDGFKTVNDRLGHSIGDALLRQVAARLEAAVPPPGKLARWGGDEFVAILPAARIEAQRANLAAAALMAYDLDPGGDKAYVKIGVSTGACTGETDLARAIALASESLMQLRAERPA